MQEDIYVVISKDRNPDGPERAFQEQVLGGLLGRQSVHVLLVPHLYDLAPEGPTVRHLRGLEGDLIVLAWLYPRSAYWVLRANGIMGRLGRTSSLSLADLDDSIDDAAASDGERTLWCFDLRTHGQPERYLGEIDRILSRVVAPERVPAGAPSNGHPVELAEDTSIRWYPVVDFSRCSQCQECLNFCLFGVFSLDDNDRVVIEEPDACRPGCPACARICPSGAIMFPQHGDPAIAGDPEASQGGFKLDLSQLFGGATPADLARAERQQAIDGQSRTPLPRNDLDDLVDGVDRMDLDSNDR